MALSESQHNNPHHRQVRSSPLHRNLEEDGPEPIIVETVLNDSDEDEDGDYDILIATTNTAGSSRSGYYYHRMESCCVSFYKAQCTYLFPMAGWFLFSALLSTYNKWVFGSAHMSFPCPLLLTSIHFGGQWMFSFALCHFFPVTFGTERVTTQMSWHEYLTTSIPCGFVASGDIGLSNLSLVSISITFYTMVKSSTPIFVLLWAYIFGIGTISSHIIGVVCLIAIGEFLTVMGEFEFDVRGFLLCLGASFLSGARWTLVQFKIQSMDPPIQTTLAIMKLLSPSMCLSMLLLSLCIEKPWITLKDATQTSGGMIQLIGLGALGAVFAIAMIMCEFFLIMHTSAIVLMIGGVLKEMLTILVGVCVFHDPLNRVNVSGCFVVFLGVIYYKMYFKLDKEKVKPSRSVSLSSSSSMNSHRVASPAGEKIKTKQQQPPPFSNSNKNSGVVSSYELVSTATTTAITDFEIDDDEDTTTTNNNNTNSLYYDNDEENNKNTLVRGRSSNGGSSSSSSSNNNAFVIGGSDSKDSVVDDAPSKLNNRRLYSK